MDLKRWQCWSVQTKISEQLLNGLQNFAQTFINPTDFGYPLLFRLLLNGRAAIRQNTMKFCTDTQVSRRMNLNNLRPLNFFSSIIIRSFFKNLPVLWFMTKSWGQCSNKWGKKQKYQYQFDFIKASTGICTCTHLISNAVRGWAYTVLLEPPTLASPPKVPWMRLYPSCTSAAWLHIKRKH